MRYLLDVNALVALGCLGHVFHSRMMAWAEKQSLCTCSISEIGFVRVLSQISQADVSVDTCRELLSTMKKERRMGMIPDAQSAVDLPAWVQKPKQITDGHLLELARSNRAALATLDEGIPGAYLIPRP